jgi:hypothetical protein
MLYYVLHASWRTAIYSDSLYYKNPDLTFKLNLTIEINLELNICRYKTGLLLFEVSWLAEVFILNDNES